MTVASRVAVVTTLTTRETWSCLVKTSTCYESQQLVSGASWCRSWIVGRILCVTSRVRLVKPGSVNGYVERSDHPVDSDNIMRVDSYYFHRYGGGAAFKIWKPARSSPFPVGTFTIGHYRFLLLGFLRGRA